VDLRGGWGAVTRWKASRHATGSRASRREALCPPRYSLVGPTAPRRDPVDYIERRKGQIDDQCPDSPPLPSSARHRPRDRARQDVARPRSRVTCRYLRTAVLVPRGRAPSSKYGTGARTSPRTPCRER
jgi:hypothetical protein